MSVAFEDLKDKCATLSAEEREQLVDFLLRSLDGDEGQLSAAWLEEIDRRVADMRAGRVVGRSAAEISAELRAKYA